jgi:hypothetical protein
MSITTYGRQRATASRWPFRSIHLLKSRRSQTRPKLSLTTDMRNATMKANCRVMACVLTGLVSAASCNNSQQPGRAQPAAESPEQTVQKAQQAKLEERKATLLKLCNIHNGAIDAMVRWMWTG